MRSFIVPEKRWQVRPGDSFGRWSVLGVPFFCPASRGDRNASQHCVCRCECGAIGIQRTTILVSGGSQSCGCLVGDTNRTHGWSKTRLYRVWGGMIDRCEGLSCPSYANYGGRGISICDEWRQSFESFREWSLANGYRDGLSIDRINNDGNYEPSNCRWTGMVVQANNRRNNHKVTAFGETKNLTEWTRDPRFNITRFCLYERLKVGIDPEVALLTPSRDPSMRNRT